MTDSDTSSSEPQILDVLDTNFCKICGTSIELLYGVGWIHQNVITCTTPTPNLHRCPECRHLVFAFAGTGRLRAHPAKVDGRAVVGVVCTGSLQLGIPPMADPWTQFDSERRA